MSTKITKRVGGCPVELELLSGGAHTGSAHCRLPKGHPGPEHLAKWEQAEGDVREVTYETGAQYNVDTRKLVELGVPGRFEHRDVDAPSVQIATVSLEDLVESPFNKRRSWGDLKELAASMGDGKGILEPLLARPIAGTSKYELVFGHRRLRAAKIAKLTHAPVMVRELGDDDALEMQAIENLQRVDLHPLEEAEGYEQLMKSLHWSADQIAEKVGKSKAFIYGRLKLLALCPKARKAFADGLLSASVALYVARVPDAKLQEQVLADFDEEAEWSPDGEKPPIAARTAFRIIDERYMLRLEKAPFDRADTSLVPKAGPCTTCPHRTGNQKELFADVGSADVCTMPPCFEAKKKETIRLRLEEAASKGIKVLEGKAAEKALYSNDYVKLDEKDWHHDGPVKTHRQRLKGAEIAVTLVVDREGDLVELAGRKAYDAIANKGKKERASSGGETYAEQQRKQKAAVMLKRVSTLAVVGRIVEAAEKRSPNAGDVFWPILAELLIAQSDHDPGVEILKRRGTPPEKARGIYDHRGLLKKQLKAMTHDQARGLVVELALGRGMAFHTYGSTTVDPKILEAAKYYRLDGTAISTKARTEYQAAKKAKKAKKTSKPRGKK